MNKKLIAVIIALSLIGGGILYYSLDKAQTQLNEVQKLLEDAFLVSHDIVSGEATSRGANTNLYPNQMMNRSFDETGDFWHVGLTGSSGGTLSNLGTAPASADYKSPEDFSVAYTSATTVTLSSLPFSITDDSQLVYIKVIPSTGTAALYINGSGGVTMREATNVVTITGAGTTPFASGDVYEMGINTQTKGFDLTNDLWKFQEQSPITSHYTDVATISATPQNFTTSWVDFGSEQDTRTYKTACVWATVDINDTNNPRIRLLAKHTSAGAEEYEFPINTVSASDVKVEGEYFEFNVDEDQLVVECWDLGNAIPYVQMQIQAGTVGASAGQIDAAYITKGY